jgi:hypothetical protein
MPAPVAAFWSKVTLGLHSAAWPQRSISAIGEVGAAGAELPQCLRHNFRSRKNQLLAPQQGLQNLLDFFLLERARPTPKPVLRLGLIPCSHIFPLRPPNCPVAFKCLLLVLQSQCRTD